MYTRKHMHVCTQYITCHSILYFHEKWVYRTWQLKILSSNALHHYINPSCMIAQEIPLLFTIDAAVSLHHIKIDVHIACWLCPCVSYSGQ